MKKILVLDDSTDILELVHEVLEYEGFEVRSESKGTGLIDAALEFKPDLVLLDYMVPETTGEELCREFKLLPEFQNIPVIIFSAYIVSESDKSRFSCDAVILKPFDLAHLVDKINELLSSQLFIQ